MLSLPNGNFIVQASDRRSPRPARYNLTILTATQSFPRASKPSKQIEKRNFSDSLITAALMKCWSGVIGIFELWATCLGFGLVSSLAFRCSGFPRYCSLRSFIVVVTWKVLFQSRHSKSYRKNAKSQRLRSRYWCGSVCCWFKSRPHWVAVEVRSNQKSPKNTLLSEKIYIQNISSAASSSHCNSGSLGCTAYGAGLEKI